MSIEIKTISQSDTSAWDTYVNAHPQATLYHLSGWKNVIEKTYGHKTYYLMAVNSSKLKGGYPMPTALELGPEGWIHYISKFRQRSGHSDITESAKDDREKLMIRIRELAAAIKTRFGARRVILFGSLAHEAWFRSDSDVDLAVEGLSGEDYLKAWGLAEEIITDRPVDLVEIETASDSMKKAIERYGVEI